MFQWFEKIKLCQTEEVNSVGGSSFVCLKWDSRLVENSSQPISPALVLLSIA